MPSIYDPIPKSPFYSAPSYSVDSGYGPLIVGSGLTVTSDGTLLVTSALGGTVTAVTAGVGLTGGTINTSGTLNLVPATAGSLGGIKVGANLSIAPDGTLSAATPGSGTITGITVGTGLSGGGSGPSVSIGLIPSSRTQFGGVIVGTGIDVANGYISLTPSTTTAVGGVQLATPAETVTGANGSKAVTPAGLAAKVASTSVPGIVQLSDNATLTSSTLAATPTAVRTAYNAALAAQTTANDALPRTGGTLTGLIAFAPGQTFPGVALPKATTLSLGVVQVGSGLNISTTGILTTANNGTVTSIIAGAGLGSPASGNVITTSGTIKLLPPSMDGSVIGGVKKGANIGIAVDGTITTEGLLQTNNPYAFNGYIWPVPLAAPALPCPGTNGQVLTVVDNVTGTLGWTSSGTLSSITAGFGLQVTSTSPSNATISLATVPSVVAGDYGATGLIPTLSVNAQGQIISTGVANPYTPFLNAAVTAPPSLVLNFNSNNTNWEHVLEGNTTIQNPSNAQSGMTGNFLLSQNPLSPYVVTWGSAWKFADFTPYLGNPTLGAVDLIQFTVIEPNRIVVTNIVKNIG